MDTTQQLIAGYTAYTDAAEFSAGATAEAPATTPTILSFIAISTVGCGAAVGSLVSGSAAGTVAWGC